MPKRKYPITASESTEQTYLFRWAMLAQCKYPELKLLYHIPNGGSRHPIEAANLKRQGVKAGVPDLCLPVARGDYHGLYLELKAGRNQPSEQQTQCLDALTKQGYCVEVCWGWEQAVKVILDYLGENIHESSVIKF